MAIDGLWSGTEGRDHQQFIAMIPETRYTDWFESTQEPLQQREKSEQEIKLENENEELRSEINAQYEQIRTKEMLLIQDRKRLILENFYREEFRKSGFNPRWGMTQILLDMINRGEFGWSLLPVLNRQRQRKSLGDSKKPNR